MITSQTDSFEKVMPQGAWVACDSVTRGRISTEFAVPIDRAARLASRWPLKLVWNPYVTNRVPLTSAWLVSDYNSPRKHLVEVVVSQDDD